MKRITFALIGLCALFVLLQTSCNNNGNKGSNGNDTLVYEIKTQQQVFNGCQADSPNCTYIRYTYPIFTAATPAADTLNLVIKQLLGESTKTSLTQAQNNFIADYAGYIKQHPNDAHAWYSQTQISVPYQNQAIVCIGVDMNDYTGGAHSMFATIYSVYSLQNKEMITTAKLFNKTSFAELLSIAETAFKQNKQLKPDADLEEAGYWFKDNKFHLNDNFLITAEGITWLFNPYEVAPYSNGTIAVTLNKEAILPHLNTSFNNLWP